MGIVHKNRKLTEREKAQLKGIVERLSRENTTTERFVRVLNSFFEQISRVC